MDKRKNLIFGIGVFVFTVVWFSIFAVIRIDMHHDAVMLKPAIDVAAGKVIFRDTFCQYGALAVWLQALAVKLFGGEIVVIQLLTVLFYGGSAVLIDRIFRRFLSWPFRLFNLVLFWGMGPFYIVPFHPWSSVYALFFMLLCEEFLLCYFDSGKGRNLWLAGAFAAAAFLARHPCGVAIFAAGAAVLIVYKFKCRCGWSVPGRYAAGAAAVLAVFMSYLTIVGAWSDYLRQCFGFVLGFAIARGGNMQFSEISKRFFPLDGMLWVVDTIYTLLPIVCMGVTYFVARALYTSRDDDRAAIRRRFQYLTVVLAGLASWHQYYPVSCIRHLYWAAIPMFGVFALAVEKLWISSSRRWRCRTAAVILLLIGLFPVGFRFVYGVYPVLRHMPRRRQVDLPGCRYLWLTGSERDLLLSLNRVFEGLPPHIRARGVFNYTPDAVLSVMLPETGFRHKMFVNWRDDVYPEYPKLAADYIMRHKPPYIFQPPTDKKDACKPQRPFPGYRLVYRGELYGLEYWFYTPAD